MNNWCRKSGLLAGKAMNAHPRRNCVSCTLAAVAALVVLGNTLQVLAVAYTWDGTGDGFTWTDPLNWTADSGYPSTTADTATFTNAASVTAGLPQTINRLFTGSGLVQLGGSLDFGPNVSPNGPVVGSGGLVVNGSLNNQMRDFSSSGDVTINGTLSMFAFMPVQSSGTWDITSILLQASPGSIPAWNILDGANTTFGHSTIYSGTLTWTGTPNITGGRPNYAFTAGGDGIAVYDVGAQTLYGNTLQLDGWPGGGTRFAILKSAGGTIDLNAVKIGFGNGAAPRTYMALTNSTIYLRGTGTVSLAAWDNRSTNNFQFNVSTGTTTYFDPTGVATQYVDTGSKDRNSVLLDPVDWQNNFAFDQVVLGTNDTITLVGDANIEGAGTNALYATRLTGLGGGATLKLNGHNVYLLKRPDNVTFDNTGGGRVYFPKSGTVITIR